MNLRTAVGRELKALWGEGRGISLVAIAFAWGVLVGVRMVYPVIVPHLQTEFGLSLTGAGLLITVLWLFYSAGQLPGGVFADWYDERTLMIASTLLVALSLGFVVTAPTVHVLFVATAVWGAGMSMYSIARVTCLSRLYSDRFGSALGLTMSSADVAQTILPPIVSVLAVAFAWQIGLGAAIPFLVVAGVVLYLSLPPQSEESDGESASLRESFTVLEEIREPATGSVVVVLFLYFFIWQSFTAFYPTYLTSVKGLAPSTASVLFGLFFAVGIVVKPVAGAAYDRIGVRGSLVGNLAPSIVGFVLLPFADSLPVLVVLTALISTMLGSGTVTQTYLTESFSSNTQGTGLGTVKAITATLAAAGPLVFGLVADYQFFDEGYLALSAIMFVAVLLVVRLPDP